MIDPLEAVLALARADSALAALTTGPTGIRISGKHRFAIPNVPTKDKPWKTPSKALVLRYDVGGYQERDVHDQRVRLAAECYGEDEAQAGQVMLALIDLTRCDDRRVIMTSQGQALIRWIMLDGTALTAPNQDLHMEFILVPLLALVAEQPV